MLQYPINVYPDKTAFDTSSVSVDYFKGIKLTFKGDMLSALYWKVYNYNTGDVVLEDKIHGSQMRPLCYNNGEVEVPDVLQSLGVGRYVLQFMLTQTRVNQSVSNPTRINAADRFVSRGKIKEQYHSDPTHIVLEDNIKVIYEWNKNGDVYSPSTIIETHETPAFTHRATEIVLHIGQETKTIVSYDASTGIATLESSLQNDYDAGTPYQLYANYLISELYYFEVAYQPAFQSQTIDWTVYGGTYEGFVWQGNTSYDTQGGTMIKYYTYELLKIDEEDNEWKIFESDKIFSQELRFEFVDDYDDVGLSGYHYKGEVASYGDLPSDADIDDVYSFENAYGNMVFYVKTGTGWTELTECGGNYASRNYRIKVNCALQNGMILNGVKDFASAQRSSFSMPLNPYRITPDEDNNWNIVNIILGGLPSDMRFRVYRANSNSNSYYANPTKELIADIETPEFVDYIAGNHGKYRYMIVPYRTNNNTIYNPIVTDVVESNYYGYTLTALKNTGKLIYGKPLYLIGDNWKLMAEIEDTDNTQNLNRVTHIGGGRYATVTGTDNNYISGSLTCELGRMNCGKKIFENDMDIMAEWRNFISQNCPYVLRNQKGDVWLVRISDGGSIRYGEAGRQIDSTVTFSWVECGSIHDYIIQNEDIDRG